MKKYFVVALFWMKATLLVVAAQPDLSLSANHGTIVDLPKGWPLIVTGTLFHSEDLKKEVTTAPLIIDPPNGTTWAEAVQLQVAGADGSAKGWNLKPIGRAGDRVLQLPQGASVAFGWALSPTETASLPIGEYQIAARLALAGTPGWNGEVTSSELTINVIEAPAVLDDATAAEKAVLSARYESAAGNLSDAAALITKFLATHPSDSRALLMQSRILQDQGMPVHAWLSAQNALAAAYEEDWSPKEPPFSLILRERELANGLAGPRLAAAWIDGAVRLTLTGNRGSSFNIETSSTLANWNAALTVTISEDNGVVEFLAPITNGEAFRFYRAVLTR